MNKSQGGFTLIELVVVIVLLGILGVTALGKFQDLSAEAEGAAVTGVASELTGASTINYAVAAAGGTPEITITSTAGADIDTSGANEACVEAQFDNLFTGDTFPAGYDLVSNTADPCTAGAGTAYTCTVWADANGNATYDAGTDYAADATLICTGS